MSVYPLIGGESLLLEAGNKSFSKQKKQKREMKELIGNR
jgi:hypothetical protein